MTNLTAGSHPSPIVNRERLLFRRIGPRVLLRSSGACPLLEAGIGTSTPTSSPSAVGQSQHNIGATQQQQALLVDLIAGQDRIQTFLALLEQVSVTVLDQRYEPLAVKGGTTVVLKRATTDKPPPPTILLNRQSGIAGRSHRSDSSRRWKRIQPFGFELGRPAVVGRVSIEMSFYTERNH